MPVPASGPAAGTEFLWSIVIGEEVKWFGLRHTPEFMTVKPPQKGRFMVALLICTEN